MSDDKVVDPVLLAAQRRHEIIRRETHEAASLVSAVLHELDARIRAQGLIAGDEAAARAAHLGTLLGAAESLLDQMPANVVGAARRLALEQRIASTASTSPPAIVVPK